jgi:hypothetical protein
MVVGRSKILILSYAGGGKFSKPDLIPTLSLGDEREKKSSFLSGFRGSMRAIGFGNSRLR